MKMTDALHLEPNIHSTFAQNLSKFPDTTTKLDMDHTMDIAASISMTTCSDAMTSSMPLTSCTDGIATSSKLSSVTVGAHAQSVNINPAVAKECASCGQKIWDRYLLSCMDRFWHSGCLKCSCCQAPLGDIGGSCFAKGGMVLCKNDYLRLFGRTGTCQGCGGGIPANELVMKVHGNQFFHLACFTCVVCQHRLTSGDRYCMLQGHLLCELDYPKVLKGAVHLPTRLAARA